MSLAELQTVQQFFLEKYAVPFSFWSDKKLLKRVHSVWVCSEKAALAREWVKADSVGIMLLLELKTLKPSKQGLAFLQNKH